MKNLLGKAKETITMNPSNVFCLSESIKYLVCFFFCIVASFWIKYFSLVSIIFLSLSFYRFFYTKNITYFISPEIIKVRTGLFSHKLNTLELYRVKDYVITQSFLMRLFKIMTLDLHTTDLNTKLVRLQGIPVSDIGAKIRENVQSARLKNKIFEIN